MNGLGAITTVPRKLGRGSGPKINDIFWGTFLDNGAFFAAGSKNYISGPDTGLGIDGPTKAEQTFLDQVDSDSKPLGLMLALGADGLVGHGDPGGPWPHMPCMAGISTGWPNGLSRELWRKALRREA